MSDITPVWRSIHFQKIFIVAIILALFVLVELVVHLFFHISIAYTHFYYLLLIFAGLWYYRRAVYIGMLLAALHIFVEYLALGSISPAALIRGGSFILVGYVSGYLFEKIAGNQGISISPLGTHPRKSGRRRVQGIIGRAAPRIAEMKERADIEGLIASLQSGTAEIRYAAADALGEIGDARAVMPLSLALKDSDGGVRLMAAEALGRMGEPAVAPLLEKLHDSNEDVRWMAALALGDIGDPRAIEPLIELLDEEDRYVRSRAAIALGNIGSPAVEPLMQALRHGNGNVRWGAALALGRIRDPSALEALIGALDDPYPAIRDEASSALGEIGEPAIAPLIARLQWGNAEEQHLIAETLKRIGGSAELKLIEALASEDPEISSRVATALGVIADTRAIDALLQYMDDERPGVKEAARKALEQAPEEWSR